MSLEDDIYLLQQIEMFSDFEPEHLRLIAFGSQKISIPRDQELFHHGDPTDGGYVVISGRIDLVIYKNETQKPLATFQRGSLIGEMALISRNERVGSAIACEDSELMKISRIMMHRILDEYPELAVRLHQRISASVRDFTQQLERVDI